MCWEGRDIFSKIFSPETYLVQSSLHGGVGRMGRIQYKHLSKIGRGRDVFLQPSLQDLQKGWNVFNTTISQGSGENGTYSIQSSLQDLERMGRIQYNHLSRIWRGWDVFNATISPGSGEDGTY